MVVWLLGEDNFGLLIDLGLQLLMCKIVNLMVLGSKWKKISFASTFQSKILIL